MAKTNTHEYVIIFLIGFIWYLCSFESPKIVLYSACIALVIAVRALINLNKDSSNESNS